MRTQKKIHPCFSMVLQVLKRGLGRKDLTEEIERSFPYAKKLLYC